MTDDNKLPVLHVDEITGKVERITYLEGFKPTPPTIEQCEECGEMHRTDALTVCALKAAKRLLDEWGMVNGETNNQMRHARQADHVRDLQQVCDGAAVEQQPNAPDAKGLSDGSAQSGRRV